MSIFVRQQIESRVTLHVFHSVYVSAAVNSFIWTYLWCQLILSIWPSRCSGSRSPGRLTAHLNPSWTAGNWSWISNWNALSSSSVSSSAGDRNLIAGRNWILGCNYWAHFSLKNSNRDLQYMLGRDQSKSIGQCPLGYESGRGRNGLPQHGTVGSKRNHPLRFLILLRRRIGLAQNSQIIVNCQIPAQILGWLDHFRRFAS